MASIMYWKLLAIVVISLTFSIVDSKIQLTNEIVDLQKPNGPNKLRLVWSNCGSDSDPVKINNLDITPEPLSVPGLLTLTADADLRSNITSPIKVSVIVKKKSFLGWFEVPCLDNMGSCTYDDVCKLTPFKEPCPPIFTKHNVPCTCPISQGHYAVKNYTFPVKAVGPHWLEHGTYKARVTLSHDTHLLGCYEFSFKLK